MFRIYPDLNSNPGCDPASGIIAPLVLILGYANGIQIWIIPVKFSWILFRFQVLLLQER